MPLLMAVRSRQLEGGREGWPQTGRHGRLMSDESDSEALPGPARIRAVASRRDGGCSTRATRWDRAVCRRKSMVHEATGR